MSPDPKRNPKNGSADGSRNGATSSPRKSPSKTKSVAGSSGSTKKLSSLSSVCHWNNVLALLINVADNEIVPAEAQFLQAIVQQAVYVSV